jgi:DNA-binding GntR family transcriptional regulator
MTTLPARQSRAANVADALRADIVSGVFTPHQRLTEGRLSERYGVSRIPVREALRGLEAEGFVNITPYRGAQVAVLSPHDALDLLEVRGALEIVATKRAAARRSWDDVQQMADILTAGNKAISAGDFEEVARLNTALHVLIVTASGNPNLIVLHEQIQAKAQWVYSLGLDDRATNSWHEHEELVTAVVAGDSELAGELARHHIAHAIRHYQSHALGELVVDDQPTRSESETVS